MTSSAPVTGIARARRTAALMLTVVGLAALVIGIIALAYGRGPVILGIERPPAWTAMTPLLSGGLVALVLGFLRFAASGDRRTLGASIVLATLAVGAAILITAAADALAWPWAWDDPVVTSIAIGSLATAALALPIAAALWQPTSRGLVLGTTMGGCGAGLAFVGLGAGNALVALGGAIMAIVGFGALLAVRRAALRSKPVTLPE